LGEVLSELCYVPTTNHDIRLICSDQCLSQPFLFCLGVLAAADAAPILMVQLLSQEDASENFARGAILDTKAILPDITLPFSGAAYQAGSMGFAASLRSLLTPFERQALSGFGSPVKQICRKLLWIRDLIGNLFPAIAATQTQTSDLLYLIKAIYTLWTLGHCAGGGTLRLGTGVDWALTACGDSSDAAALLQHGRRVSATRETAACFVASMGSEWAEPLVAIFMSSSWQHCWKDLVRGHPLMQHLYTSILQNTAEPGLLVIGDTSELSHVVGPSSEAWEAIDKSLRLVFDRHLQWLDFAGLSEVNHSSPAKAALKAAIAADPRLSLKDAPPPYAGPTLHRDIREISSTGVDCAGLPWCLARATLCMAILKDPVLSRDLTLTTAALELLGKVVSERDRMPSRAELGLVPIFEEEATQLYANPGIL